MKIKTPIIVLVALFLFLVVALPVGYVMREEIPREIRDKLYRIPGVQQLRNFKKKVVDQQWPQSAEAPWWRVEPLASLGSPLVQEDFPAVCIGPGGTLWVVYISYESNEETLQLAEFTKEGLTKRGAVSEPGNVYQPCLAYDGNGTIWIVWSQLQDDHWNLLGRSITNGKLSDEIVSIADSPGNDVFPDAKADRHGRVWVTWQSFHGGHSDIFVKYCDRTNNWSERMQVTDNGVTGDWEPKLAFGNKDEALVLFDSYRNGNFDVFLATVSPAGKSKIMPITVSERYEARGAAATSPDGATLWVAYEDGPDQWGKDSEKALHYDRHLYLARVDPESGKVSKIGDITALIPGLMAKLGATRTYSICLPNIVVDNSGNPWVFFRYGKKYWRTAVVMYDIEKELWTQPLDIASSAHCQDRRVSAAIDAAGRICAVWPSDGRKSNQQYTSAIYLTRIDTQQQPHMYVDASAMQAKSKQKSVGALSRVLVGQKKKSEPTYNNPERLRSERHFWNFEGEQYALYWGDLHRHTDFSTCLTSDDGCVVEQFRYGYDAGGLDFMAITDHTEHGKLYHEYEWWQTQKLTDMFHNPGYFLTFYGYEREQNWPYGHRNVIFLKRGGPIAYQTRENLANARDAAPLPPEEGVRQGEIPPWQLWELLRKTGMRVTTLPHTSASLMGTDWSVYDIIDSQIETLVEIYQGGRKRSYEGASSPQPHVGTGIRGPANFGRYHGGTYQNALRNGHKLGVFASSDHRSTNLSYGGVYVKKFNRESVFDAMNARHTIAATDKIFVEFSCNGRMLGEIFQTSDKPEMKVSIRGTAPLKAVTIMRNEVDFRRFCTDTVSDCDVTFTDEEPKVGENRYYVRVEQSDGNMAWTSPVWVTYKP